MYSSWNFAHFSQHPFHFWKQLKIPLLGSPSIIYLLHSILMVIFSFGEKTKIAKSHILIFVGEAELGDVIFWQKTLHEMWRTYLLSYCECDTWHNPQVHSMVFYCRLSNSTGKCFMYVPWGFFWSVVKLHEGYTTGSWNIQNSWIHPGQTLYFQIITWFGLNQHDVRKWRFHSW